MSEQHKKSLLPSKHRKQQKGNELSNFVFGKLPPQALPLEEAVIGALMLDKDALPIVIDILRAESFYKDAHQIIYKAILKLFEKSNPIDLLTVTEELKVMGELEKIGGPYYLVELTNRVTSSANIEYHARIIAQKHIQRELISVSTSIINDAYEDTTDVFDLLDKAEQGLFSITEKNLNRGYEQFGVLAQRAIRQMEEMMGKDNKGLTGISSGFTDLDRITSGWQASDLIIVAARPGMGKTAYTLALARNAAVDFNQPVAFFSLEMSKIQLVQRLISLESQISGTRMRNGDMNKEEWQRLQETVENLSEIPIFIDDTPGINVFELRAKCRRLKMQHNIQMVIVDYLQLMTGGGDSKGNREQEISAISRALKGIAKELEVPVIALSQLSRAVETRGGTKRPQLSDLRESGAIEQDADIVTFIYRPEYYNILEDEEGNSLKNTAEIIIAKHRNGALDTVKLRFIKDFAKFTSMDDFNFNDDFGDNNSSASGGGPTTLQSKMNEEDDVPF